MAAEALVIGGGITGLSAAHYLKKKGVLAKVIESDRPGGVISTCSSGGFVMENGPNVLLDKPELLELARELDLEENITLPSIEKYRQEIFCGGRVHELPKGLGKFVRCKLFTPGEKLRILRGLFSAYPISDHPSVAEFFCSRLGPAVRRILQPAMNGIYGGSIDSLSAEMIFPGLLQHARTGGTFFGYATKKKGKKRIFTFEAGIGSLVSKLERDVGSDSIIHDRAARLKADGSDFLVELSGGGVLRAPYVLVCTHGANTAAFLREDWPELSSALQAVRYSSLAVVQIRASAHAAPADSFGVLFEEPGDLGMLGVMFKSSLFPGVAPAGQALLTVCLGGVDRPDVLARSDQQIAIEVKSALAQKLKVQVEEVLSITRWPKAIPQPNVGQQRLRGLVGACEKQNPGLAFASSDLGGVGVPDRVAAAAQAVEKVISAKQERR